MHTEKSRLRRSLMSLQELMREIRHQTISDQIGELNAVLRGHYGYYGVAGNIRALFKVHRAVERCAAAAEPAETKRGTFSPDKRTDTVAAAKTAPLLPEAAGVCGAAN